MTNNPCMLLSRAKKLFFSLAFPKQEIILLVNCLIINWINILSYEDKREDATIIFKRNKRERITTI